MVSLIWEQGVTDKVSGIYIQLWHERWHVSACEQSERSTLSAFKASSSPFRAAWICPAFSSEVRREDCMVSCIAACRTILFRYWVYSFRPGILTQSRFQSKAKLWRHALQLFISSDFLQAESWHGHINLTCIKLCLCYMLLPVGIGTLPACLLDPSAKLRSAAMQSAPA